MCPVRGPAVLSYLRLGLCVLLLGAGRKAGRGEDQEESGCQEDGGS